MGLNHTKLTYRHQGRAFRLANTSGKAGIGASLGPPQIPGGPGAGPRGTSPGSLNRRYARPVARDNTVRLGPRWLQLPPGPGGRSYAGSRVELRECLDGRLAAILGDRVLAESPPAGPGFGLQPRARPQAARRAPRTAEPPAAPLPALAALARYLRHPARPHPGARPFHAANVRSPRPGHGRFTSRIP